MMTLVAIGSRPRRALTMYAIYEPRMMKAGCAMLTMSRMPKEIDTPIVTAV